jgi:hypothetical protein
VSGIPIFRETRDFAAEIPSARFHEKPPLFIAPSPLSTGTAPSQSACAGDSSPRPD